MEVVYLTITAAAIGFIAGNVFGTWAERRAWVLRANPRHGRTPYCVNDTEFYYVIPEHEFVTDYVYTPRGNLP